MLLSQLQAAVEVTGSAPGGGAEAAVAIIDRPFSVDPGTVVVDLTFSLELLAAVLPRGAHQVVGLRVTIDGVVIPAAQILPGATVSRALGERASFSIPFLLRGDGFRYPAGRPDAWRAPAPGKLPVDIDALYLTATGGRAIRLVTRGVADNSEEQLGELDTYQLNGIGPGGRIDHQRVDLDLPPGHGRDRARVVGQLLTLAGDESSQSLEPSGRMYKELAAVQENAIGLAQPLLKPSGRVLQWSPDGVAENPIGIRRTGRVDWALDERDLLMQQGTGRVARGDGPTKIIVTGSRQVVTEGCGRVTTLRFVEAFAFYAEKRTYFLQDTNGDLQARGSNIAPTFQLVSRVTTIRETICDTLHSERVISQGFYNPSAARYRIDTAGAPKTPYPAIVWIAEPTAVKDDGNPAFSWPIEYFVTLSDILTTYQYEDGIEVGRRQISRGWAQRRAAVKFQTLPASVPWEEVAFTDNTLTLGDGEGVADLREVYFGAYHSVARPHPSLPPVVSMNPRTFVPFEARDIREVTISPTEDGAFIQAEAERVQSFFARSGAGSYYYTRQGPSLDAMESLQVKETIDTIHEAEVGESSHATTVIRRGPDGRLIRDEDREAITRTTGNEGYLPPTGRDLSTLPDAAIFGQGQAASRFESQEMSVSVCADVLKPGREAWTLTLSDSWAETEAELERIGRDEISDRSGFEVAAFIPLAAAVREGSRVSISIGRAGFHLVFHVRRVTHTFAGPGGFSMTTLEGKEYVA